MLILVFLLVLAVQAAVQAVLPLPCIAEELQQPAQHREIMAVVMVQQVTHTHLVVAAGRVL